MSSEVPRLVGPALLAILQAIDGIESVLAGRSLEDYSRNWLLKHGVERGIEIISEATRRIPPELRDKRPEVPWKQIIAIGNILRHNYDKIADRIVYDTAVHDLVSLRVAVAAILSEVGEPEAQGK